MDALIKAFLENGTLLGLAAALVALGFRVLYVDARTSQTSRVQDAQAVVDRILKLVADSEASKRELARAIDENTEAMRQLAQRCPGASSIRR